MKLHTVKVSEDIAATLVDIDVSTVPTIASSTTIAAVGVA